ncbi:SWIM zinc finger family protein [Streptomyces liliifuscus]|uniref:SWIM zinc finger family protein n=1 Tax=Streptomyces liliifuscus TaxID=2797636 RepID=A0A7T7L1W1_9ACTN|nr:SWIM zinc finger family protein [Streptomyces liliifuscus]QQM44918.1 SWIM zinc finger family protein [Streptomyces liliifuscus]
MTQSGTTTPLPPVAPEVFASAVESLTTRLRGRLDAAVEALTAAPVTVEGGTFGVRCGEDALVTLAPDPSGTVTDAEQARCTCLLAPRCLHRAAVLGACPVAVTESARPVLIDPSVLSGSGAAAETTDAVPPTELDRSAGPGPSTRPNPPAGPDPSTRPNPPAGPDRIAHPAHIAEPNPPTHGIRPTEQVRPAEGASPTEQINPTKQVRPAERVSPTGRVRPAEPNRLADPSPQPAHAPANTPTCPSATQIRAAAGLWTAAAAVLSAGTAGTGAVLEAELLRAAHMARLTGLHRAEAAALSVVRCLRTARDPYSPPRLAELVTILRELLLVSHLLKSGDPEPALIGAVRRNHRPDGSLRLYGICREPVVGADDLGGVVTHLLDDDGRWYTLRDVQPGGPARARRAGTALVAIRSFLSDHFRVSRGGLIISGATVSPEGRLLAERGVRATFAAGRPWAEAAPATVFARPLAESAAVRFPASLVGESGGTGYARPLIGCDVEIAAPDGEDLLVRELPRGADEFGDCPPTPGPPVRLAPAHSHPALAHTANFQQLGARPGLRIRVLGRLDPDRVTTLRALAVGPVPGTEATLRLPDVWQGRADLGYDLLHSDHFPPDIPAPSPPTASSTHACRATPPGDSPLWRVRRLVELAVTGGRRIAAESTRGNDHDGHAAVLRRSGLVTGSDLITALGAVAGRRSLDVFGRHSGADPDQYATQWLATAVYLAAAETNLRHGTWPAHEHTDSDSDTSTSTSTSTDDS